MINQSIQIGGLANHLLCSMWHHLNNVQRSKIPNFLAHSPSEARHAIQLVDPLNAVHLLIICLQLEGVASYFDMHSPSIMECENEKIPKIHLTA